MSLLAWCAVVEGGVIVLLLVERAYVMRTMRRATRSTLEILNRDRRLR